MAAIFVCILALLPIVISVPKCYNDSQTVCELCEDYTDSDCQEITDDIIIVFSYQGMRQKIDYNFFSGTNVKIIHEQNSTTFYSCNRGYIHVNRNTFYPTGLKLNFTTFYKPETKYSADRSQFQICLDTYCLDDKYNTLICRHHYLNTLKFQFSSHVTPMCLQNITSSLISARHLTDLKNNNFFGYATNLINLMIHIELIDSFECDIFRNLVNLRLLEIQLYGGHGHQLQLVDQYKCIFGWNPNLVRIQINDKLIWNTCNDTAVSKTTNWPTFLDTFVLVLLLLFSLYLMVVFSLYLCSWNRQHATVSEDPGFELHEIRTVYV